MMLHCSRNRLHAASAKHTIHLADALLRTAFLDVSSLNFGGAKSSAVFSAHLHARSSQITMARLDHRGHRICSAGLAEIIAIAACAQAAVISSFSGAVMHILLRAKGMTATVLPSATA